MKKIIVLSVLVISCGPRYTPSLSDYEVKEEVVKKTFDKTVEATITALNQGVSHNGVDFEIKNTDLVNAITSLKGGQAVTLTPIYNSEKTSKVDENGVINYTYSIDGDDEIIIPAGIGLKIGDIENQPLKTISSNISLNLMVDKGQTLSIPCIVDPSTQRYKFNINVKEVNGKKRYLLQDNISKQKYIISRSEVFLGKLYLSFKIKDNREIKTAIGVELPK